jgi:hypothetical protein
MALLPCGYNGLALQVYRTKIEPKSQRKNNIASGM